MQLNEMLTTISNDLLTLALDLLDNDERNPNGKRQDELKRQMYGAQLCILHTHDSMVLTQQCRANLRNQKEELQDALNVLSLSGSKVFYDTEYMDAMKKHGSTSRTPSNSSANNSTTTTRSFNDQHSSSSNNNNTGTASWSYIDTDNRTTSFGSISSTSLTRSASSSNFGNQNQYQPASSSWNNSTDYNYNAASSSYNNNNTTAGNGANNYSASLSNGSLIRYSDTTDYNTSANNSSSGAAVRSGSFSISAQDYLGSMTDWLTLDCCILGGCWRLTARVLV
jgi:hypothetical protein